MQFGDIFVLMLYSILLHVVMANDTCEQDLAVIKEKRLGAIRNQILSKLNMTEAPPNPKQRRVITPDILAAYSVVKEAFERDAISRSTGCVDNNYFARKVSLFIPENDSGNSPPSSTTDINRVTSESLYTGVAQDGQNLSFSIALPSGSSNEVDYAEIRLRKHCEQSDMLSYVRCNGDTLIYGTVEIYLHINNSKGQTQKVFVAGKTLALNDGKMWEEFTITEALQRCLANEPFKTELHLELEIKSNPSSQLSQLSYINPYLFFQNSVANLTSSTQLVVFTVNQKDVESARRKRQVTKDFCLATQTSNCCVRSLTINFHQDLNWTWVIAPEEYQPNYCSGDCPYLWPTATLHAENLQTVKMLNPAASAEPCCVPAMLLPLTIIREDETTGALIFEPLSEMIVDSCICR